MHNSALSLQVSHIDLVDTSFTLGWPLSMELSSASWARCQIWTHSLSPCSQKASLEGTLRDTEQHYHMQIDSFNNIVLGLEAELTELRHKIQLQTQDYEALLNTKMKLEAEIATYRRLLDGEDFTYVYSWSYSDRFSHFKFTLKICQEEEMAIHLIFPDQAPGRPVRAENREDQSVDCHRDPGGRPGCFLQYRNPEPVKTRSNHLIVSLHPNTNITKLILLPN